MLDTEQYPQESTNLIRHLSMCSIYSNFDYEDNYQGLLEADYYLQKSRSFARQPSLCSIQIQSDVECKENLDDKCELLETAELPPFTSAQLKKMWARTPYLE